MVHDTQHRIVSVTSLFHGFVPSKLAATASTISLEPSSAVEGRRPDRKRQGRFEVTNSPSSRRDLTVAGGMGEGWGNSLATTIRAEEVYEDKNEKPLVPIHGNTLSLQLVLDGM